MYLISNSNLRRFGRISFWPTTYCRNVSIGWHREEPQKLKWISCVNPLTNRPQLLCNTNSEQITGCANWIQVRFKENCPRFHRDYNFPNFDSYRKNEFKDAKKTKFGSGDDKPGFTYVLGFFGILASTYCAKVVLTDLIMFMAPAADVLALASIEIDLSKVTPGGCLSYKWRGKPLFIKNRTQAEIDIEANTPMSSLRDPQTPEERSTKPEWLIVIGICTHLGCVPIPNTGDYTGGFYCPCHGSHYDNVGRARKGPAPTNLEVPPYTFISDTIVLVG